MNKDLHEKKELFEKDYSEREKIILENEKEYSDLKAKIEKFPEDLTRTIKDAEQRIKSQLEMKFKYEADVLGKEVEGEIKLNQQMIQTLELKIKEKDEVIQGLSIRADESGKQIQNIAERAIDGASKLRVIREDSVKQDKMN